MPRKPSIKNSYYKEESYDQEPDSSPDFPVRKIVSISVIILVILIVLGLIFSLLAQSNNRLIFGPDGGKLATNVSISKNGKLIDSFKTDGNNLLLSANPEERISSTIKTNVTGSGKKNVSIVIRNSNGQIQIISSSPDNEIYIDENGLIHFSINPMIDLNLEEFYDENTDTYIFDDNENLDLNFEFVIENEDTNETTIIDIGGGITFQQFPQSGCIALNRSSVKEATHYGFLELNTKLLVSCDSYDDLMSSITWSKERTGNVEIIFGNYKFASVLSEYERTAMPVPAQGEYDAKIIFTPFKESAGQKASFSVNFGLGTSKAKIDFDIAIDNLEQCIKITPESMVIPSDQDSTTMTVDASSCHSKSIEVSLCDNDEECSGGTEGGIDLSQSGFTLTPSGSATKTITISRKEISGAYGIPVYARITGTEKSFIDEKLVIIQPKPEENIIPDKFVISLLGGTRDSITVHNKTLAEDVEIETSICNLYKSSLGITGDTSMGADLPSYGAVAQNSWWYDLATNQERYAGAGKYQAALINTLASLDNIRATTQATSAGKNSLIKTAFLDAGGLKKAANTSNNDVTKAIKAAEALKDKIDKANEFSSLNLVAQVVSLLSSVTSLAADVAILSTSLEAARTSVDTIKNSGQCSKTVKAPMEAASKALETADSTTKYFYAEILEGLNMINQLYQIVNSIVALTTDEEIIAAENALNKINEASKKIKEANEKIDNTIDYLLLALQAASIDSFVSAPKDDARAADYLLKAKEELLGAQALINIALEKVLLATSDITTELPDLDKQKTDMIIQATSLLVNMILQWTSIATKVGIIETNVDIASEQLYTAFGAAGAECASCAALNACDDTCCTVEDELSLAIPQVTEIQYSLASIASTVTSSISTINTIYQAFEMYQQIQNNYQNELADAQTTFTKTSDSLYALQKEIDKSIESMDPAIEAAEWLSAQEKNSSAASKFEETDSLVTLDGEYNKKRMIGLIGSAISNGFVNGAYEGGVYTTKNTFNTQSSSPIRTLGLNEKEKQFLLADDSSSDSSATDLPPDSSTSSSGEMKEDCANKVKLILPDYVVNLIQDGKQITVTNPNVIATWVFDDAKVFDVFEEQEVGVVFAGSSLRKSGYGIVEFNYEKHVHENPAQVSSEFGPFNVPDSKELMQAKYHFRFNAEPRKGNNYVSFRGNDCTTGLLRGTNGTGTSSNLVLSWDWNSIKPLGNISGSSSAYKSLMSASIGSGSNEEPFIDATQLSILVSKKIGSLTNFLDSVSTSCPENPAKKVLDVVRPEILNPETGLNYTGENALVQDEDSFCYIPLTTRTLEGKPALYYFIENRPLTEWEQWFEDSERVNSAEELLSIIDFNVNLVRDGYGLDFQYDFVNNYSKAILKAGSSFLDPSRGAKKYFSDKDNIYFSSQANFLKSNNKWTLPDAGKYRVRLLIDFDGSTAKMFNGSSPSAKVIVELYSLEPVNNNYSPWYYTPIDGSVGLSSSNNRRGYGSSVLSSGTQFDVSKKEGSFLDSEQKESLVRISSSSITNFFLLNALPSLHGKILDYSYNYNTKTFRDENSKLIFSPTVATPLLFELHGTKGEETGLVYSVKKDNQEISSDLGNLFLLSYVGNCSDLAGKALSKDFQRAPDLKEGKMYRVILPRAETNGKTFLKTIAYSPIDYSFGLVKEVNEQIYSTNDLKGINNPVALTGIASMPLNDKGSNSVTDSLINVLEGVEKKSICVSSLGSREIFWWPEDSLFEKQGTEEKSLSSKENDAKASCVIANSN
ncbi:MAG: hypothetical protein WC462_04910 [archaeon]